MASQPDLAGFTETYQAGRPQVVWTSLVADLETPVSAMLKLAEGRPYSFLLESVEGGAVRGRYSAIGRRSIGGPVTILPRSSPVRTRR